jgi:FkbM family methyltransferase
VNITKIPTRLLGFARKPVREKWASIQARVSPPDRFLRACHGIVHVGANVGQERDLYAKHGLKVLWIEPIPETYATLLERIRNHPGQIAINALITDRDNESYTLHIANNSGASSSIFDLYLHKDISPKVHYVRDLLMTSETLLTALCRSGIPRDDYDALAFDTQGSEILVLKGAAPILTGFKWIKTEAADFESYRGGTTINELIDYLKPFGFHLWRRNRFAEHPAGGAYYDALFKRR